MNLAEQLESLKTRGFDQERAHTVVLIREAAILLFEDFPDSFLLYGGANLISSTTAFVHPETWICFRTLSRCQVLKKLQMSFSLGWKN
jgi:hypothetical protein